MGKAYGELTTSFSKRRFAAFFIYIIGVIVVALAVYRGFTFALEWVKVGYFEIAASFLSAAVYYIWLAFLIVWAGKAVSAKKIDIGRTISIPVLVFAVSIVIYNASQLVLKAESGMFNFIIAIVIGFALIIAAIVIDKTEALSRSKKK